MISTLLHNVCIEGSVQQALAEGRPVVALESTIIAHGMPYPKNLATANALEKTVRDNGATPATIAVLHGRAHVGLTAQQLHTLATDTSVRKLALRDLTLAYARGDTGATTVSATMWVAHGVGISVFATGGIGGVHRGVAHSWDISADVTALASVRMVVVCAGAKAILDIGKTLEALETASVPVLTWGADEFPAFYTRASGHAAAARVDTATQVAKVHWAGLQAGMQQAVLLAVPVPREHEADAGAVHGAIERALEELSSMGHGTVAANQVTPFLLRRVAKLTDGGALKTNMRLAENNARVAAQVAVEIARLEKEGAGHGVQLHTAADVETGQGLTAREKPAEADVVVVGAAALDIHCGVGADGTLKSGESNIGQVRVAAGGVGLNVATAAARLSNARVKFFSLVGSDVCGRMLGMLLKESERRDERLEVKVRSVSGRRSAACCVVEDKGGDLSVRG